jgi:hypothetical protein
VSDTHQPGKRPEQTPAPDDVGLYAPKERYSRDIPAEDEGPPDAPVVRGPEPGGEAGGGTP